MKLGTMIWLVFNAVALILSVGYAIYGIMHELRWKSLSNRLSSMGMVVSDTTEGEGRRKVILCIVAGAIFGITLLCVWSGHFITGLILQVVSIMLGYVALRSIFWQLRGYDPLDSRTYGRR